MVKRPITTNGLWTSYSTTSGRAPRQGASAGGPIQRQHRQLWDLRHPRACSRFLLFSFSIRVFIVLSSRVILILLPLCLTPYLHLRNVYIILPRSNVILPMHHTTSCCFLHRSPGKSAGRRQPTSNKYSYLEKLTWSVASLADRPVRAFPFWSTLRSCRFGSKLLFLDYIMWLCFSRLLSRKFSSPMARSTLKFSSALLYDSVLYFYDHNRAGCDAWQYRL